MIARTYRQPLGFTLLMAIFLVGAGWLTQLWTKAEVFWPGYGAMVLFYGLVFYIGLMAAQRNQNDPFLANRSMPLWMGVFTMSATWIGGGFINGTAEYTYSQGLIWVQAPWGYAASLIVGGLIFAGPMRRGNYQTMLDPLEQKFGRSSNRLFFIPALFGDLFWSAAILVALASTFGTLLGLDFTTSLILSGVIVIIYTAAGGFWSVAMTDVLQLGVLIVGLFWVSWNLFENFGDIGHTVNAYKSKFGDAAGFLPDRGVLGHQTAMWWDGALLLVFGGIPWQVYFQRVLASKDSRTAIRLSIFSGLVCLLASVPPILIGMKAAITNWAEMGLPEPSEASSALPHVIQYLCDPWMAMIALGAIAAAVMSSADSSILASSSLITWNVANRRTSRERQNLLKKMIWVVGSCAILIALKVGSVYQLWYLCSDLVYCLLFPALVTALFDPKANRWGAYTGFLVALVLRLGGGEPMWDLAPWIPYPQVEGEIIVPFKTIAMLSGLFSIIVVSRLFPERTVKEQS